LDHLDELAPADGRTPALFLDYDGTLTPIVARPEDATLGESMRATLRRLAQLAP
ncbi:MAG: trehalose-phosphatase, partial [Burkholderiales bacterium]|nr:trehalose-phosphatase [Burkholderiales bacterium]